MTQHEIHEVVNNDKRLCKPITQLGYLRIEGLLVSHLGEILQA